MENDTRNHLELGKGIADVGKGMAEASKNLTEGVVGAVQSVRGSVLGAMTADNNSGRRSFGAKGWKHPNMKKSATSMVLAKECVAALTGALPSPSPARLPSLTVRLGP